MKRSLRTALAVLAATVIPIGGAHAAQTVPENLGVSLEIVEACEVGTIEAIAFGTQGTLGAAVDAEGSVSVTCPEDTEYSIALDVGQGDSATVTVRKMTGPASATINYTLYSDAGRNTVWGDEEGNNRVTETGSGAAQVHPIYARVPSQDTPAVGLYTDIVTVIVHY